MTRTATSEGGRRRRSRRKEPTPTDTRDRIVVAAVACVARRGWDRTSVTAIAAESGFSRPTIYSHFPDRTVLMSAVIERAAMTIVERLVERASRASNSSDFILELVLTGVYEFRSDPATSLLGLVLPGVSPLSAEALAIARTFLQPLLRYEPTLATELDEIAETIVRFLLSLMMFESPRSRSPRALRAYLTRRLLPALGLPPPAPRVAARKRASGGPSGGPVRSA